MRVLVTRPQAQAVEWVARLQALGVAAAAVPLLGIDGPADLGAVQQAWAGLAQHRAVMFVSPNAVERFFAAAPAITSPVWPAGVMAAGTGPGTEAALLQAGVPPAQVLCPAPDSPKFDSEALWPLLRGCGPWAGASMLVVRGEGGRDWLAERLRAEGATVHFVEAYRRSPPVLDEPARVQLQAALVRPDEHVWLFSSSEAVQHLPGLAAGADWSASLALATHPRIAQAAAGLGFARVEAVAPTPEAVTAWVRAWGKAPSSPSIQSQRS